MKLNKGTVTLMVRDGFETIDIIQRIPTKGQARYRGKRLPILWTLESKSRPYISISAGRD
jgi:hypothetical protein